ncbi:hypothetical protein [Candidatus Neptunochlamydia vexilliferae]|nr:hypothetical protein [Candidatus Neptunochlamydia vexilliferae]
MDKDTLNYYRHIFLESLEDISNSNRQQKAWMGGDYKDFNTFTEIFESFASPCEYVMKWPVLSDQQREDLKKLYDMLMSYQDKKEEGGKMIDKTDSEICQDPLWNEIRTFARKVYRDLEPIGRRGQCCR